MQWIRHHIQEIGIFFLYVVLTIFLSWSGIRYFASAVPFLDADTYQALGLVMEQTRILKDEGIFSGLHTIFSTKDPGIITIYAFLSRILGNVYVAYNLMFVLSFALSGLGMFLLVRYLTKNVPAGLLTGTLYAFAPYHFYHATETHIGAMHQEWLPFFALALFLFFEKFRFKYFLLTIGFTLLITLTEHQQLAFSLVFIALFAFFQVLFRPRKILLSWRPWTYLFVSAFIVWGAVLLFFSAYLSVATSDNNFLDAGIGQAKRYSITPVDIFMPSELYYFFGAHYRENIQQHFTNTYTFPVLGKGENGASSFVGFTSLAILSLLPLALIAIFMRESWKRSRWIIFWIATAIIFYVLAMGPEIDTAQGVKILPYNLIYENIPFFENIRTVGRFFVYALLGIAVVVGYIFTALFSWKKRWIEWVIFSGLAVLLLFELYPGPIQTYTFTYSPLFDKINKDPKKYSLLEIPGSTSYPFASYQMMNRALHGKNTIGGTTLSREIDHQFEKEKKTPVISDLLYEIPDANDPKENGTIAKVDPQKEGINILNYFNVGYVILHKDFLLEKEKEEASSLFVEYIKAFQGVEKYEDDFIISYKIPKKDPEGVFIATYDYENKWKRFNRETRGEKRRYGEALPGAPITIVNMGAEPKDISLQFDMKSDDYVDLITVRDASGKALGEKKIGPLKWDPFVIEVTLPSGETVVTIDYPTKILQTVMISNIHILEEE